jgi:hypothetical protein
VFNNKSSKLLISAAGGFVLASTLAACGGNNADTGASTASQSPQLLANMSSSTQKREHFLKTRGTTNTTATDTSTVTAPTDPTMATAAATTTTYPSSVWLPTPGTSFQIQYSGTLNTSLNVKMYDIDAYDTSATTIASLKAKGIKVICYFSAGSYENWRPDTGSFPASVLGNALDGWPDERWLDIRQLTVLRDIMGKRMDMAASKGCDGVDPDNMDGYTNDTGFPLTAQDQLNYNKMIAQEAHNRNLSVSLKNDIDQVKVLAPYFDFAVNEQCFQYKECGVYTAFTGLNKAVFGMEYKLDPAIFCPKANAANLDFLKKNLSLDAARISCR